MAKSNSSDQPKRGVVAKVAKVVRNTQSQQRDAQRAIQAGRRLREDRR